jgi:hypothetical protein
MLERGQQIRRASTDRRSSDTRHFFTPSNERKLRVCCLGVRGRSAAEIKNDRE